MKKAAFAPTLILASLFVAGVAQADPYSSWTSSDDDSVKIEDSFKSKYTYTETQDNDVNEDNDITLGFKSVHKEDNDITTSHKSSEDNDVALHYQTSEDNDVSEYWSKSEDNDITDIYTHTQDNDVTEDNDWIYSEDNDVATDVDVDFLIATPTLTSYKHQSQDAGHSANQAAVGSAQGHEVDVRGGTTVVNAGNDEQAFFGPAMVNNNTNQLPQNNLFVQGGNGGPIGQANTFAGRDMGPKGVFAPIGNTSAAVAGDVGQSSSAGLSQSGDSANSIADSMSAPISK